MEVKENGILRIQNVLRYYYICLKIQWDKKPQTNLLLCINQRKTKKKSVTNNHGLERTRTHLKSRTEHEIRYQQLIYNYQ